MADDEQRALVIAEETEQPDLRVDVEVVGRFVEAQDFGPSEENAGQFDTTPLATGQSADRLIEPLVFDAEPSCHLPRFALGRVAAVGPERLFGVDVATDVALIGVLFHGNAQLLDAHDLVVDSAARKNVRDT